MTTAASSPAEPAPAPSALHPTASSGDAATPSARPAPAIPSADDIVAALLEHNPDADADMVRKAYEYSSAAHAGQLRLSGDPYFKHPTSVAKTLAEMGFD